jgi:hypothetical protein
MGRPLRRCRCRWCRRGGGVDCCYPGNLR